MTKLAALLLSASLGACAADHYTANQVCARNGGCVSSFADDRRGPIHAQAVAPEAPSVIPTPN